MEVNKMKRKLVLTTFLTLVIGFSFLMAHVPPKASPQRGVAYGNVLKPGWSTFYQWYKGRWGHTHYRRKIQQIQINMNSAMVVFTNGSRRNFYNMAIINNVDTTAGSLRNWNIARKSRFDTILLKNGKMIHPIIRGYNNGHYYFKGRLKPIHRRYIHIVYPNPSIPLRARL